LGGGAVTITKTGKRVQIAHVSPGVKKKETRRPVESYKLTSKARHPIPSEEKRVPQGKPKNRGKIAGVSIPQLKHDGGGGGWGGGGGGRHDGSLPGEKKRVP